MIGVLASSYVEPAGGSSVSVVETFDYTQTSGTADPVVATTTGATTDDVVVVVVGAYGTAPTGVSAPDVTFTLISTRVSSAVHRLSIYYAIWPDGTQRDITVNGNPGAAGRYGAGTVVARGVDLDTGPFDVTPRAVALYSNPATNPVAVPGMTTVTDGALVIASMNSADDNTLTGPSESDWVVLGGANLSTASAWRAAYKIQTTAGATGTATFTQTTSAPDYAQHHMFALRPA